MKRSGIDPPNLSRLREKLSQQWEESQVQSQSSSRQKNKLPSTFASKDDVEKLAKHLTHQVGYNNELLSQMKDMERETLMLQKESMITKQGKRQALAISAAAKRENAELRRRLAVAQEVANRLAAEGKASRTKEIEAKRSYEHVTKEKKRFEVEYKHLMEEREILQTKVAELTREAASLRLDSTKRDSDEAAVVTKLRLALETRTSELTALQSKHFPVKEEAEALRRKNVILEENIERMKEENASKKRRIEDLDAKLAKYVHEGQTAAIKLREAENKLAEANARNYSLERLTNTAKGESSTREEELEATRRALSQLTGQKRSLEQENFHLKEELLSKKAEIEKLGHLREAAQNTFDKEKTTLRKEATAARSAMRNKEIEFSKELERIANDYTLARKSREEEYMKLQKEYMGLIDLQQQKEQLLSRQMREFDVERAQNEKQLNDTRSQLHAKEQEMAHIRKDLRQKGTDFISERRKMCEEKLNRTDRHVQMLSALIATLGQLRKDVKGTEKMQSDLASEFLQLRAEIDVHSNAQHTPDDNLYLEFKKTIAILVENLDEKNRECNNLNDKLGISEQSREKLHIEEVTFQDTIENVKYENQKLKDQLLDFEAQARSKLRAKDSEIAASKVLRDDLQERLERAEEQQDILRAQTMALHSDLQRSNTALSLSRSKQHGTEDAADQRLSESTTRVQKLTAEKQELLREREQQHIRLADRQAEVDKLNLLLEEARTHASKYEVRLKSMENESKLDIAHLSSTIKKMQGQIVKTKEVLDVVMDQRSHYQNENKMLRLELEKKKNGTIEDSKLYEHSEN